MEMKLDMMLWGEITMDMNIRYGMCMWNRHYHLHEIRSEANVMLVKEWDITLIMMWCTQHCGDHDMRYDVEVFMCAGIDVT